MTDTPRNDERIILRLPAWQVREIEDRRGALSKSAYVRQAIAAALKNPQKAAISSE